METTTCSTKLGPEIAEKTMIASTRRRRGIITAAVITVGAIAWYLFRPELLFIDKNVNEAFPTAGASTMTGTALGDAKAQGDVPQRGPRDERHGRDL